MHEIKFGVDRMQPQNQRAINHLFDRCTIAVNLNLFSINQSIGPYLVIDIIINRAGMTNYNNEDVVTYYKMVNFINNSRIDMYSINVTSKELTTFTIIDKLIFKLQSLNIYNFLIYNSAIYVLSKELGVCYIRNQPYNYCWKFNDVFNVFSVYIQQNGFHNILLGSTTTSDIFKAYLLDDDTYKINQIYKLSKNMTFSQIFHNDKYSFIIGHKNNNTRRYFIEIYSQMDDFTSNLYKTIEIASSKELFYFDSLNNNAYAINNKSIFIITPQVSYLTIDDGQCFDETIEIKAQVPSMELDTICNFIFHVIKLEEGSQDIYDKSELEHSLIVLNQSINNFYLNNFVIGPNVNYYLYNTSLENSNENDFEKIKFKEQFTISYAQTMEITSIIYNRAFKSVIGDQYIQIIQWRDLTLQIFNCVIPGSEKDINCVYKQNFKLLDSVLQIVSGLQCSTECFVIRQQKRADLYIEYNNKFIFTNCFIESQYNIQTIKLHLEKYLVELENNKIQIFLPTYRQTMTCNFEKVFEIDSLQLEELINTTRTINIFNVKTNINIYNIYISTNLGLIIIDPGLLRFQQVQLIAFVQFNQQFDTVLQVIRDRIITLQYKQITIINLVQQNFYYTEKTLPNFNFTITNITNSQVAFSQNYLYLQAKDANYTDVIIVYKVDEPEISSFHTYFIKNNNLDFSLIQKQDDEVFLIQLFEAQKLYSQVNLQFKSSQSKIIKVVFQGFKSYAKLMDINVNVKTAEKQYNLSLLINETQSIIYDDSISDFIKLDGYNDFIDGSVSEWSIKCFSCQKELELINNINYNQYLTQIPNATQIKHTVDYVLIQQEQSIIAIDNFGMVKFYIPLPVSEYSTKCTSITANTWENKTKLVVSVCNTKSQAQFYITSFLSSLPVPMGPFYSPLVINQITHIRMLNEILFILDVVTEYVYLFNLTIDENQADSLRVMNRLNAREFTADKGQVFINLPTIFAHKFIMQSIQITIEFIIYTYPQDFAYTLDLIFFLSEQGFTDLPSNIVPQSLIVAETAQKDELQYYRIIVANQNFHHYELEISIGYPDNSIKFKFVRAYMQYGYFYANGKIRVSEETQGFFGLIYQNPLDEKQKLLIVYDRFSKSQEKLRKILGGYKICSNNQILFDFLHFKKRNDEFSYGIILQDGPVLSSLTLSRYLAIKVNFKEFQTQNITFNASNDFGKWVSFKADIYNRAGQANLLLIMLSLAIVVFIVIFSSWLYVMNKLKKLQVKELDAIMEEEEIVKESQ
ncbi:unnamed protein product (macronuclear) [Paramecium tetraurelia]|uniref:Transmembrane protein n=1 Tax=Paramecium tetraurelia TaxID=5888 RepID=A0C0Z2_PARTE|nr:uncharacterized protein GSPATT00033935001 [Paramecium tetraurelia]CAK64459.1 unnamed protein product [Paramecium tetraurelia]|eukprot:XP_001431857.1 hypothetical protein (macronuclear) [Paramecium tetraurelia strain d4-2]